MLALARLINTVGNQPGTYWDPWALGGVIVVQGFSLWIAWAWALQWAPLKRAYQKAARWIDGAFGLALLGLAVVCGLFPALAAYRTDVAKSLGK